MYKADVGWPMLHSHDAPLKGSCNSQNALCASVTTMCEGGSGINPMNGGTYREHIVGRLAQTAPLLRASSLKPAAVLLPIVTRPEPTLLFTRRTDHLTSHAGQICFPGGRFHAPDETLIDTALREVEEETGISRALIEIAGFLDPLETRTGYAILPIVGFMSEDFVAVPSTEEVAEIFEAPLGYVLDPKNRQIRSIERKGVLRDYYAIDFDRHTIWGVTAAIIANFAEKLRAS